MNRLREELKVLWQGQPVKATSYAEFMCSLGLSEAEARELERQEQLLMDQEIARYPKVGQEGRWTGRGRGRGSQLGRWAAQGLA